MEAMGKAVSVIRDIATAELPDDRDCQSLGIRCRRAVKCFMAARQGNLPNLSTVDAPLSQALDETLTILANVLANVLLARAEHGGFPLGLLHRTGSESWVDVARRCVDAVASTGYEAERRFLQEAIGRPLSVWEIHRVRHPDMESLGFLTDWWVVIIPPQVDDPNLLAFVERLAPMMAEQLSFTTFIVFGTTESGILPLGAHRPGGSQMLNQGTGI